MEKNNFGWILPSLRVLATPVEKLHIDPENARRHGERNLELIRYSFEKLGQILPLVANPDGKIIIGNGRLKVIAEHFKWSHVAVVWFEGTAEQYVEAALLDNKTAELAEWDYHFLRQAEELHNVSLKDMGFDEDELREIFAKMSSGKIDHDKDRNETTEDEAETLRQKWDTRDGQVWTLGRHTLICCDYRDQHVWLRLLNNKKFSVVSDPPYGIGVRTNWLSNMHKSRGTAGCKSDEPLEHDDGSLDLSWIYSQKEWLVFGFPWLARDERYTGLLVWDKRGDGGERGLGTPVEVAASNAFSGYKLIRHLWAGFVREGGETRHPIITQKPVGVMLDAIGFVKGKLIFDPFVGSGTTIIACEELGIHCLALELKPSHIAVCLERWSSVTGVQPILDHRA